MSCRLGPRWTRHTRTIPSLSCRQLRLRLTVIWLPAKPTWRLTWSSRTQRINYCPAGFTEGSVIDVILPKKRGS